MKVIILNKAGADLVRGKYGKFSAIEPVLLPNGKYIVPERCLLDKALVEAAPIIESEKEEEQELVDLPQEGEWCEAGRIYKYIDETGNVDENKSGLVFCVQSHNRTIYPPFDTPALFSFFRENTDELEWIPNEYVYVDWKRWYNGTQYDCLQSHQTLTSWTPDVTPALWEEIIVVPDIPVWVQPTGGHDAYNIGDQVYYPTADDHIYESKINANVWSPAAYPAGWQLIS